MRAGSLRVPTSLPTLKIGSERVVSVPVGPVARAYSARQLAGKPDPVRASGRSRKRRAPARSGRTGRGVVPSVATGQRRSSPSADLHAETVRRFAAATRQAQFRATLPAPGEVRRRRCPATSSSVSLPVVSRAAAPERDEAFLRRCLPLQHWGALAAGCGRAARVTRLPRSLPYALKGHRRSASAA